MVEVFWPNPFPVGLPVKPVAGCEKYGWLNKLKNSVRNSIPTLSPIFVLLNTAKSKLLIPGPRRTGSTRDSVPGPKSGGAAKHEVLNHSARVRGPVLLQPGITSGRMFPTPRLAASSGVEPE